MRFDLLTIGLLTLRHYAHLADAERSLSIWRLEPEEVRVRAADDPLVRAHPLAPVALPWMIPSGPVSFSPGRLPRSRAEVAYE